jgi:ankyrin repeat protein
MLSRARHSLACRMVALAILGAASVPVGAAGYHQGWDLMEKAGRGDLTAVKALLKAGANADFRRESVGDTPLMAASAKGHLDVVRTLLAGGAQVNARSANGGTALLDAARPGHLTIVNVLLTAGADVNAGNTHRETALQAAAGGGHLRVVETLLAAGAKVNTRNRESQNALSMAAGGGHLEVVKALVAAKADPEACTPHHGGCQTPLLVALWNSTARVITFAGSRSGEGHPGARYLDVAHVLLGAGANVHAKSPNRSTPLRLAVQGHSLEHRAMVKALIFAGADVNEVSAPSPAGNGVSSNLRALDPVPHGTALEIASDRGDADMVRVLLGAGARVDVGRPGGKTALMLAQDKGHHEVAELLRIAALTPARR